MIEIVVAYDEKGNLGGYFTSCKNDLLATVNLLEEMPNTISEISSQNCNSTYLNIVLNRLSEVSFIMIAYMHGNESQIVANNVPFVQIGDDNSFFKYSLFYTNSCLSGKFLGPDLISQQCKTFIGYDQDVIILEAYSGVFVKCHNQGITGFLTQDITAFEAFEQMRQIYTQEINKMHVFGDILSAALLVEAREALVFLGDKSLKKEQLVIQQ